jgi:hypothetical protein
MANIPRRRVYRLQNLPPHVDRLMAAEVLADTFFDAGITPGDVHIFSLASKVHNWTQQTTKVATLMFRKTPEALELSHQYYGCEGFEIKEWKFRAANLPEPLILDTHFDGLTPLNDVHKSEHTHE